MTISRIQRNELYIWWANLRDFDLALPALWSVLSRWEQARAERFRLLCDRENYIIRHGLLRMLLGAYVGRCPSNLNFNIGPNGKPELADRIGSDGIYFNLSHSGDVALYGFTGACPIGVDVERVQPIPQWKRIAREFFSQAEVESLTALPKELRFRRFFDLWTRKEAVLKATGDGLGSGLIVQTRRLSWSVASNVMGSPSDFSAEWNIRSFSPLAGYVAAVAFCKPDLDIVCRSTPAFFSKELRGSREPAIRIRTGT